MRCEISSKPQTELIGSGNDTAAAQYQNALTLDPQNKAMREALKRLQKR